MARGINIEFVANVAKFLRGTGDIEEALDDVIDALDDVGTSAKDSEADAAKALEGIGADAKTAATDVDAAAEKMEQSFRASFDKVEAQSKATSTAVSSHLRRGVSDEDGSIKGKGKALGSELTQNIGEGIGSGQANLGDVVFGTVGGALGDIAGPLGGIAAGAGLALVIGMVNSARQRAEKVRAQVKAIGKAFGDAFTEGVEESAETANRKAIIQEALGVETWEEAATKIQKQADILGVSAKTLADNYLGLGDAQVTVANRFDALRSSVDESNAIVDAASGAIIGYVGATGDQIDAMAEVTTATERSRQGYSDYAKTAQTTKDIFGEVATAQDEVATKTDEATQAVKDQRAELDDAADTYADYRTSLIDVKNAEADLKQAIKERADEGLTKQERRDNLSDLIDLAGAIRDASDATLEQTGSQDKANKVIKTGRDNFVELAEKAGLSEEAAKTLATQLGLIPSPKVDVSVDTKVAQQKIDDFTSQTPDTITIPVVVDTSSIPDAITRAKVAAQNRWLLP